MNAERFRMVAGLQARHVGFKGQPEFLIEVMAARVQYGVAGLGPAMPMIKEGRLLPLAVLALLWIHTQRVPRAKTLPPREVLAASAAAMIALSLAKPALSQGPADLSAIAARLGQEGVRTGMTTCR